MAKKNRSSRRPARSAIELLLEKKAKALLAAEKNYWDAINSLRHQRHEAASTLDLPFEDSLPQDISSTVWGLKDGVAFVRHKTVGAKARVNFRVLPITLDEWGNSGLIVPLPAGEFSLARAGFIRGLGNLSMINCAFNDIHIPFVQFSHLRYGDPTNTPSVERAVLDFQLALLGLQTQPQSSESPKAVSGVETVAKLKKLADELESLIGAGTKEEEIQLFLKANPFVLHPSAECIPKKKLGEDFVTDFVLVSTTTQGPTYILVELERSSHAILNKDLVLSGPVNHAIKQTRDWDVWLEKNKAYIQNKLPGFETPTYLVVIGRGHQLSDDERAYLRSYNREWKNTTLLTYDDVLSRFRSTITNLEAIAGNENPA
ncbi:hypothetical protein BST81_09850 [Leptolyngbya sp. 'hensonii']|uniref:Shedu anti-phage system protein SduA domain-containing protein n=1 Tax=Leptolyngbya sp. 'hensonii' TaxID=1922337 RepID=UPI00094F7F14|nr:Shedu anti-phage system protein SduA domain-containing protein [Leptolyngbya sp. 'hensonii']OLP18584.1 hypothetical protein BST81_09850 [Leptolyngbya sp. 'hensonii']